MFHPRSQTCRPVALAVPFAALSAALFAAGSPVHADTGFIARAAFETGGDELEAVRFDDGSSASIDAGGGVHLELGGRLGVGDSGLETDVTIGYKFDSITASNADVSFARITLDAVQYVRLGERFRVGGGLRYELGPTLDIEGPDGFGGRIDSKVDADDAFGYLIAADYLVGASVELGLRATFIDYEFDRGGKREGNSIGGYATFRF